MEEAREIMDLGFYLGIGGVVTFKKSTLPELLKDIAVEHLLLETDAPYLAPTPHRGGRNESAYIPLVAGRVAAAKGLTVEEVGDVTTANARKLFVL
jgi:TatD DNase family protein